MIGKALWDAAWITSALNGARKIEKHTLTPLKRRIRGLRHIWNPVRLRPPSSYDAYVETQNQGNKRKLSLVAAREANIAYLAGYCTRRVGRNLSVLCHGTRNGAEIRWFQAHLPADSKVLGTDIAESANRFPDTVQWDFHELKDEWIGAWDVVYSNSWDHAYDPQRAFRNWIACLSPRGIMILEHSSFHTPAHVTDLDPFGATFVALRDMLDRAAAPDYRVADVITDLPDQGDSQRCLVVTRRERVNPNDKQ